jgi:hypothetical protein
VIYYIYQKIRSSANQIGVLCITRQVYIFICDRLTWKTDVFMVLQSLSKSFFFFVNFVMCRLYSLAVVRSSDTMAILQPHNLVCWQH